MFCDIRYDKTIIVEKGQQQNSISSSPTATNLSLDAMFVVCWIKGSNYNWKHVRFTWGLLTLHHFCVCAKPRPEFSTSYVMVSFYVLWFEVKDSYSICWYWWNCWRSLFKLLHNRYLFLYMTRSMTFKVMVLMFYYNNQIT